MSKGMFTKRRSSATIREYVCGRGHCDFCGKTREIVARRGIQCCVVCHGRHRVVDGRIVFAPDSRGAA